MSEDHNTINTIILDALSDISPDEAAQNVISRSIINLQDFLNTGNYVTEKKDPHTNIISVSAKRTYNLPAALLPKFFTLAEKCRLENKLLHYAERQETANNTHTGIMIDFDCYQYSNMSYINDNFMTAMSRHLVRILNSVIDFKGAAQIIYHIFFIKKHEVILAPSHGDNVFKDGFHILIPELQITKPLKRYIINEIIQQDIFKLTLDSIGVTAALATNTKDTVDKMSAANPVHFFGHSKPGKQSYLLARAIKITQYVDSSDSDREILDVDRVLKSAEDGINLTYELSLGFQFDEINGKKTWLRKNKYNPKPQICAELSKLLEQTNDNLNDDNYMFISSTKPRIKYVTQLLELLNHEYYDNYDKWFKVLCAISSCGTTPEWKSVAREFSKKSAGKWNQAVFDKVWGEIINGIKNKNNITLGSLKHWARECSPARLADIDKVNYGLFLRRIAYTNNGKIEHADVAKLLCLMIGDKYVVGVDPLSTRHDYIWYEFVYPDTPKRPGEIYKWRRENSPGGLQMFISDVLPSAYDQVLLSIQSQVEKTKNADDQKKYESIYKNFKRSKHNLQNNSFQEGVIKQARIRFRQYGFCEELDSYPNIIGVGNGILKIGEVPELIARYHDYRISKYTPTLYIPYSEDNPYIKTLLKAFHDIFIEEDVFEYMMCLAATGLDNREASCILTIIVGGGQNGKTFFVKMIHNTLGNMYSAAGKSSLLTSAFEHAGSANSAQMQQKDKRWFYIDEFNKCESLNIARVKSMVTASWQSGRDNYQYQSNYKNTSNTIALSNYDFILDCNDHGTWRRIYYYTGKSKFCSNPDPNNKFEKLVDDRFITEYTNAPEYQQAMLSIMVHYYSIYITKYGGNLQKIPVPTILHETEEFRNRQDTLNRFLTQYIVVTNPNTRTELTKISGDYIKWYQENVNKKASLMVQDISIQLINSRIRNYIKTGDFGISYCAGLRLREHIGEPYNVGETSLSAAEANKSGQPPPKCDTVECII